MNHGTRVFGGHVFRACVHFSLLQWIENSSKMEKTHKHFVSLSRLLLLCALLGTEVTCRNVCIFAYPTEMFGVKLDQI